jgi:hypothetical protein
LRRQIHIHSLCALWSKDITTVDQVAFGLHPTELGAATASAGAQGCRDKSMLWAVPKLAPVHVLSPSLKLALHHAARKACSSCKSKGASLVCAHPNCGAAFHTECAYSADCEFNIGLNTLADGKVRRCLLLLLLLLMLLLMLMLLMLASVPPPAVDSQRHAPDPFAITLLLLLPLLLLLLLLR